MQANTAPQIVKASRDGAAEPDDQTLANIRELLYGDTRRELKDQIAHLRDRQREFEEWTRAEMRKMAEDMRKQDRREEEARRESMRELSNSVLELAEKIAKLAEA